MKSKLNRVAVFVLAICLGAATITGCSENNKSTKQESLSMTTTEIKYEPTDEIKNADLHSGLVQIGNDIFRNGGYYTVNQFIEEYGDRYDMSEFDPKENYNSDLDSKSIRSKTNPDLVIKVYYTRPNDNKKGIPLGEDIVVRVMISSDYPMWYPSLLTHDAQTPEEIEEFCKSQGLKKAEENEYKYDAYGVEFGDSYFFLNYKGNEKNLLGEYPVLIYTYDKGSFFLSWVDCFNEHGWKSPDENEE